MNLKTILSVASLVALVALSSTATSALANETASEPSVSETGEGPDKKIAAERFAPLDDVKTAKYRNGAFASINSVFGPGKKHSGDAAGSALLARYSN